jgi:hypothetical protein
MRTSADIHQCMKLMHFPKVAAECLGKLARTSYIIPRGSRAAKVGARANLSPIHF